MTYRKLIVAVISGWISVHSTLVLAGAYEDMLHAIRTDNQWAVTDLLKRGMDIDTVSPEGETLLMLASREGKPSVVKVILAGKPKIQTKSPRGESALMLLCLKGELELAKMLIKRDADINHPGWTPLHYAATGGHTAIIQLLLDESAYIDAESPNGSTPLMMAARYGNDKAVQLLLSEGADHQLKNQLGLTALDFAVQGRRPESIKLLQSLSSSTEDTKSKPK